MSEERCREAQGKRRKLGCYASHAATAFKREAVRVTRWHGGEEQKHPLGYFLLGLLVVGVVFSAGGALLAYNFEISNPTALEQSLAQQTIWKDGKGNTLANGATVSGTITVQTSIPAVQVAEVASIYISWGSASGSGTVAVPYYVSGVEQYVYKSGDSTPLLKFPLTPSHSSYATDMQNWMKGWSDNLVNSYNAYLTWFKASVPVFTYTSETWSGSLDTLNLGKGSYRIFTCITWSPVGANTIRGAQGYALPITTPEPPSLSGASWHNLGAVWLSSLLLGEDSDSEPTGPQVTISANATSGDPPLAVFLNSTVTPGTDGSTDFAYLWDFGDGQTSIMAQPGVHVFSAIGYYNVKLTVTDALGRSGTETIRIIVGTPSPPGPDTGLIAAFLVLSLMIVAVVLFVKRR